MLQSDWKEVGIKNQEHAKKFLNEYAHSSYLEYQGNNRSESVILERSVFPQYFNEGRSFDGFIDSFFDMSKPGLDLVV